MNERDLPIEDGTRADRPRGGDGSPGDGDVRRLLETAGPRPRLPEAQLEAIGSATRMAWERQLRQREAERTPWLPRPLAMALVAMLALAVGLGGWWLWQGAASPPAVAWVTARSGDVELVGRHGYPLAVGEPIPPGAELVTAAGRAALRLGGPGHGDTGFGDTGLGDTGLGDTIHLRLDADTRLRLASDGLLELARGAVYVDTGSAEDAAGGSAESGAAIEVRTPFGSATDLGTRFTVRVVDDPPAGEGRRPGGLEVRVRDGAVLTAQDGRTWRTEAGGELTVRADGTAAQRQIEAWGSEWEWVLVSAPAFDLEGKSLGELLDWVARETGWQVELADPARAESWRRIVLHGSLGPAGSEAARPDRALFTVLPGAGLEAEIAGGRLTIRAAS